MSLLAIRIWCVRKEPHPNGMYNSGLGFLTSPGGTVDGDGDHSIDQIFPATSSFRPGVRPDPCTCSGRAGGVSYIIVIVIHVSTGSVHVVLIPIPNPPLAVTLTTFSAEVARERITLSWSTASEIDNEGFNILRSTNPSQLGEAVNSSLIPAEGGPAFGASYTFIDDSIKPGVAYYYLLEDISTFGERTLHGAGACTLGDDSGCKPLEVTIRPETEKPKGITP